MAQSLLRQFIWRREFLVAGAPRESSAAASTLLRAALIAACAAFRLVAIETRRAHLPCRLRCARRLDDAHLAAHAHSARRGTVPRRRTVHAGGVLARHTMNHGGA